MSSLETELTSAWSSERGFARRTRWPTEVDWERNRELIFSMYVLQDMTLPAVMHQMKVQYHFNATYVSGHLWA